MDTTLALLNFTTTQSHPCTEPIDAGEDFDAAVERIESAAVAGDLTALANEFMDLRSKPNSHRYTERPGDALYLAVYYGHHSVIQYLLNENVRITTNAVKAATFGKDRTALDILLRNGWNIDMQLSVTTPSALALAVEDAELTAWLLDRGASPNARCSLDLTPLSIAVELAPVPTILALFAHGGSVEHGQLLHYAVRRGLPDYLEVLGLILSKNPPLNDVMYQRDSQSYFQQRAFALGTPLHEAAERNKLDVVQLLLRHGSQPLIKDSCGEIPLERARREQAQAVITYLEPITAATPWPHCQFTESKETSGWS